MKKILAEILTIGDEILYGQITDTNSQWISAELDKIGIKTIRKSSVGDVESEILKVLTEAEERADIILITGGLGPTKDDITKKTLAKYFNSDMVIDEAALADVTNFFTIRGRELTEINRLQALVPAKCKVVRNRLGTAPGMWFEKNEKVFVSMPGVPFEMHGIMKEEVLKGLQSFFNTPFIYHKIIRTIGIGESMLAEKIEEWEDNLPEHIGLAYLPSIAEVKLRLTGFGTDEKTLEREIQQQVDKLIPIAGKYIYGYGEDEIEKVIGEILLKHNKRVAIAESCTGGFVNYSLARIPGASNYLNGGVVAYQNEVKVAALGVNPETLRQHGAVSEQTVIEMATNIRKRMNADIGISTSGIAGPSGGTPDKPVGTVWIAYDDGEQVLTRKLQLGSTREINIKVSSLAILNLLRLTLEKIN